MLFDPTAKSEAGWYAPMFLYSLHPAAFPLEKDGEEIRNTMRQIGLRNLSLEKELAGILKALETVHVPVILLKGCHLVQAIYPWDVRPVGDMDLLIKREDFPRAHKVIRDLGYQPWMENFPLWIHCHFSGKLTYTRSREKEPFIPLDLHFSLGPYPYLARIEPPVLWNKAREIQINGHKAYTLCPEHLLIHLSLHLLQHTPDHWPVCGCDIAALIHHEGSRFPWEGFLVETKKAGVNRPVRFALEKVGEMFGELVPEEILNRLAKLPPGKPGWNLNLHFACQKSEVKKYLLQFLSTPGWRAKLGCFPYILPFFLRRLKNR
ncbi:MAG: nucleotidyltransferase family protein [Peptococcaceae bacterium]|jgi:hypothetical protein|nr:nucleotidyltransferase family protein [Peptococcaceae bacterium]MDH7523953.1 nucleotidyltransferase family protein [Peptococcaceae bacterium]